MLRLSSIFFRKFLMKTRRYRLDRRNPVPIPPLATPDAGQLIGMLRSDTEEGSSSFGSEVGAHGSVCHSPRGEVDFKAGGREVWRGLTVKQAAV